MYLTYLYRWDFHKHVFQFKVGHVLREHNMVIHTALGKYYLALNFTQFFDINFAPYKSFKTNVNRSRDLEVMKIKKKLQRKSASFLSLVGMLEI